MKRGGFKLKLISSQFDARVVLVSLDCVVEAVFEANRKRLELKRTEWQNGYRRVRQRCMWRSK